MSNAAEIPGLAPALQRARAGLRNAAPTARTVRPADLFGTYFDRQELAETMSGTANRKSQAYRSAMRRIQRWERGAEPGPRLRGALDQVLSQLLRDRAVAVNFGGTILVSRDERFRDIQRVALPSSAFLFEVPFPRAFLASYGLPGARIVDVEYVDARWAH